MTVLNRIFIALKVDIISIENITLSRTHFPLCLESVLGMPRIEIEFEFDMVFCFGICFGTVCCFFFFFLFVCLFVCLFVFFFSFGFTFNTMHDLLKVIVL